VKPFALDLVGLSQTDALMSKQAQSLDEKLETLGGQVGALGEQLGAIFQKPKPAPEPVELSTAIFTQDGWSEWAGQAGHPEWLQVLATYPRLSDAEMDTHAPHPARNRRRRRLVRLVLLAGRASLVSFRSTPAPSSS